MATFNVVTEPAKPVEVAAPARALLDQIQEEIVAEHAFTRQVSRARLLLSPGGERLRGGDLRALEAARAPR